MVKVDTSTELGESNDKKSHDAKIDIQRLTEENSSLRNSLEQIKNEFNVFKKESNEVIASLNSEIKSKKNQDLDNLKTLNKQLMLRLNESKAQNESLSNNLKSSNSWKEKWEQLMSEFNQKQNAMDQIKFEAKEAYFKLNLVKSENVSLKEQINELKFILDQTKSSKIDENIQQADIFQNKIKLLEQELNEKSGQLNHFLNEKNNLELSLQNQLEENKCLQDKLSEKNSFLNQILNNLEHFSINLENNQVHCKYLEETLENSEEHKKELELKLKASENYVEELKQQKLEFENLNLAFQQENERKQNDNSARLTEIDFLNNQLACIKQELENLAIESKEKSIRINVLNEQLEATVLDSTSSVKKLTDELYNEKKIGERLQHDISVLEKNQIDLHRELGTKSNIIRDFEVQMEADACNMEILKKEKQEIITELAQKDQQIMDAEKESINKLKELESEKNKLSQKIEQKESEIQVLKNNSVQDVEKLTNEIQANQKRLNEVENQLQVEKNNCKDLIQKLSASNAEIEVLTNNLSENSSIISKLNEDSIKNLKSIQNLNEQIMQLRQQLNEKETSIEKQNAKIAEYNLKIDDMDNKIAESSEQTIKLNDKLNQEKIMLTKQLEEKDALITNLNEILNQSNVQIEELGKKLTENLELSAKQNEAFSLNNQNFENQILLLKQKIDEKDSLLKDSEFKQSNLADQIVELNHQLSENRLIIDKLNEEISSKNESIENEFKNKLNESQLKQKDLADKLNENVQIIEKLQGELSWNHANMANLHEQIAKLNQLIEEQKSQMQKQREQQSQIQDLNLQIKHLEMTNQYLNDKLTESVSQIKCLKNEISAKDEVAELNSHELKQNVANLERKVTELNERIYKQDAQIEELNQRNNELSELDLKLKQLESSNDQLKLKLSEISERQNFLEIKADYDEKSIQTSIISVDNSEKSVQTFDVFDDKTESQPEIIYHLKQELLAYEIMTFNLERELKVLSAKQFKSDLQLEPTLLDQNELSQIMFVNDSIEEVSDLKESEYLMDQSGGNIKPNDSVCTNDDINFIVERNSNYKSEIEFIKKKLSDLFQNNAALQSNEETLKMHINELNERMLNYENEINLFSEQFIINKAKLEQAEASLENKIKQEESLTKKLVEIQNELDSKEKMLYQLTNNSTTIIESNEFLKTQNNDLNKALSDKSLFMNKLTADLNEKNAHIKSLEAVKHQNEETLASYTQKLNDQDERIKQLENENDVLLQSFKMEESNQIQNLKSELVNYKNECENMTSQLQHLKNENESFILKIKENEADVTNLKKNYDSKVSGLTDQLKELIDKLEKSEEAVFNLSAEIKQYESEISSLKNRFNASHEENESIKACYENKLKNVQTEYEVKYQYSLDECNLLKVEISHKTDELNDKEAKSNALIESLKLQLSDSENKLKSYEELKSKLANEIKLLSEANERIQNLNEQISSLNESNMELKTQLENVTNEKIKFETKFSNSYKDIMMLQRKLCNTLIDKENLVKDLIEMNAKYDLNRSNQEKFQLETQKQLEQLQKQNISQQEEHKKQIDELKAKISSHARKPSESLFNKIDKHIDTNVQQKFDCLIEEKHNHLSIIDNLKLEISQLKAKLGNDAPTNEKTHGSKEQLGKYERRITKLNSEIKTLKETVKEMQETNDFLTNQINNLNTQIYEMNNKENSDFESIEKQNTSAMINSSKILSTPLNNENKRQFASNSSIQNQGTATPSSNQGVSSSYLNPLTSSVKRQNQCAQQ